MDFIMISRGQGGGKGKRQFTFPAHTRNGNRIGAVPFSRFYRIERQAGAVLFPLPTAVAAEAPL
jgi:hypothetical protein